MRSESKENNLECCRELVRLLKFDMHTQQLNAGRKRRPKILPHEFGNTAQRTAAGEPQQKNLTRKWKSCLEDKWQKLICIQSQLKR